MPAKTFLNTALAISLFFVVLSASDTAHAKIIYVDADVAGANNGSSWADAYNYLQDALADANSSPKPVEIRVAKGVYKPDQGIGLIPGDREATFQLINGVTIKGGYAGFGEPDPNARDINAYETILNRGLNPCHIVTGSGTDTTAVIDGFTITGGSAGGPSQESRGGGLYCWTGSPTVINCIFSGNRAGFYGGGMYFRTGSPVVTNCIFRDNSADEGGGMYCLHASPKLTNCTFSGNSAHELGGGMLNWGRSMLTNCTFIGNSAGYDGGGMFNFGAPILINCTFSGNSAGDSGGGMESFDTLGDAKLINCIFEGNTAQYGGGMFEAETASTVINCIFRRNSADSDGGGICNWYRSFATLINCTFSGNSAGNEGGGIYHKVREDWDNLTLTNCTFAGNSAEKGNTLYCTRVHLASITVQLANCILWDDGIEIWNDGGSMITISYSDVRGGQSAIYDPCVTVVWGAGNIDVDPCFADPGYWDPNGTPEDVNDDFWVDGDYHLLAGSPCIDAGDPNYVAEPNETDLDGNPRVINGLIDMGAYEYSPPIQADVRIVPRTISLASSGKWIVTFLRLPEDYNVSDINPNSVSLENEIKPEQLWFSEDNRIALIKFDREEVQNILNVGEIEMTITGRLTDGTPFEAADIIKVIDKAAQKPKK